MGRGVAIDLQGAAEADEIAGRAEPAMRGSEPRELGNGSLLHRRRLRAGVRTQNRGYPYDAELAASVDVSWQAHSSAVGSKSDLALDFAFGGVRPVSETPNDP